MGRCKVPSDRLDRLKQRAALASVTVAVTLIALKAIAWWLSGAVAMLGSLMDSGLDLLASAVTLVAIRTALTPADDNHRFGHGKAEALSALFQSGVMATAAVLLMIESIARIGTTAPPSATGVVVWVSLISVIVTLGLVLFQRWVLAQTGSLAIAGDHLHYKGDLAMNVGVVAAALLSARGLPVADAVGGMAIAGYIAVSAYGVCRPAIDMLMDRELDAAARTDLIAVVSDVPGVAGCHDLRTRQSGSDQIIQLHIDVDGDLSVAEGHAIAERVRRAIESQHPGADILVHVDPVPAPAVQ